MRNVLSTSQGFELNKLTEILERDEEMALLAPVNVENQKQFLLQPESMQKMILANMSPNSSTNHFAFEHIINLTKESRGLTNDDDRHRFLQEKQDNS